MEITLTATLRFASFNELDEKTLVRIIESADDTLLRKIEDWLYTEYPAVGSNIADDVYRRRMELNKKYEDDVSRTERHAVWVSNQTFIG